MTAEAVPQAPVPEGWTISDIDALPANDLRYELVDSVPRVMTPPTLMHQQAQRRLTNALEDAAPPGMVVAEGVGVILALDQRSIPDIVVLRSSEADSELSNFSTERVLLVTEVMSRLSRSDDRFRKPAQYAQAGIAVYPRVELDPTARRRLPDRTRRPVRRDRPRRARTTTRAPRAVPPITLDLTTLLR